MPFTLVIRSRRDQEGAPASERVFDQPVVAIGRAATADLALKDPQKMVSSRHGEIRQRGASWIVVDLGSTNGTLLNGVRLTAQTEYCLQDGDQIGVGDILLTFKAAVSPQKNSDASQPVETQGARSIPGGETEELLYLLRRAYADPSSVGAGSRDEQMQALLRRKTGHLDPPSLRARVGFLKKHLLATPVSSEAESRSRPAMPTSPLPDIPSPRHEKSHLVQSDLQQLVQAFLGDIEPPQSREQAEQVVRRIEQVLRVVFAGLADAVKGRREFQREFEVEATRILDWTPNPIKHAETAAEIASLLLNPRSGGVSEEHAKGYLQEIFQDLTLHQLGLMAGFRECVRGLLKEFDPAVLVKGGKEESASNRVGLLGGKNARIHAAAWQRFLDKYRQMTEEEVRVFEQILAPHFAKGYLSIQRTRRRK